MPPKSSKSQTLVKVKRQASIYFVSVLPTDTIATLKAKIVDIVNKSGGVIVNDELKPPAEGNDGTGSAPTVPVIGAVDNSSDEEPMDQDDEGYDTDDTAPMVTPNSKLISLDQIELATQSAEGEMEALDADDKTKIQGLSWQDFTTVVFKLPNEEFAIFSREYGKE